MAYKISKRLAEMEDFGEVVSTLDGSFKTVVPNGKLAEAIPDQHDLEILFIRYQLNEQTKDLILKVETTQEKQEKK